MVIQIEASNIFFLMSFLDVKLSILLVANNKNSKEKTVSDSLKRTGTAKIKQQKMNKA